MNYSCSFPRDLGALVAMPIHLTAVAAIVCVGLLDAETLEDQAISAAETIESRPRLSRLVGLMRWAIAYRHHLMSRRMVPCERRSLLVDLLSGVE